LRYRVNASASADLPDFRLCRAWDAAGRTIAFAHLQPRAARSRWRRRGHAHRRRPAPERRSPGVARCGRSGLTPPIPRTRQRSPESGAGQLCVEPSNVPSVASPLPLSRSHPPAADLCCVSSFSTLWSGAQICSRSWRSGCLAGVEVSEMLTSPFVAQIYSEADVSDSEGL